MTEPIREYHVGECVRYKPHFPGDEWDEELWWIATKTITAHWGRPAVTLYEVAKVADPEARWRVDGKVRADMLAPATAPLGFHTGEG
jgi:hypothetical protein